MDDNYVEMSGTVKRDARGGKGVLDFALEIFDKDIRSVIVDCRTTSHSIAYEQLGGEVKEGQQLSVAGHLERRTSTEAQRIAGVSVSVRQTSTIVFVDEVLEDE